MKHIHLFFPTYDGSYPESTVLWVCQCGKWFWQALKEKDEIKKEESK